MKLNTTFLSEPALRNLDLDSDHRMEIHRKIQSKKRMIREVFKEFHERFHSLDRRFFFGEGIEIEIGAGIAPMRESYPSVLATDIVQGPDLDFVLDAENMTKLSDHSVRVIFGQNCFHHFPHPERFFEELERVLVPGGGAILLEPYYGILASFVFKHIFTNEDFDKDCLTWDAPQSGPMKGANQALSYIVFKRDVKRFLVKYPFLAIVHHELLGNYPRYLLSGGLNFRQLLPDCCIPAIKRLENILSPLSTLLSLHHIVVIRRA